MEGVEGKYRSPWREIEVGKDPTEQIWRGAVGEGGGRSALLETSWPAALLIEDGSWGKKEEDPVFPQGPPYIGQGAPPEVPVVRLTVSSADARRNISG